VVAALVLAMLVARPASAGPAAPTPIPVTQPDGTTFQAVAFGDEWSNGYETLEGYTIVLDESTGFWHYAALDGQGQLVPSDMRPGIEPPLGLEPHLREEMDAFNPYRFPILSEDSSEPDSTQNIGTQAVLVILVEFDDRPSVGTTAANWNSNFFGASGSVGDFYDEVSYGNLAFSPATESHGTPNDGIVGWINVGTTHPDTRGINDANRQLTADAIVAANPYVDYSSYDGNGDGFITPSELHIVIIVAGYETSYGGSTFTCPPSVWGHRWSLGFGSVSAPIVDGVRVGDWTAGGGYTQFGEWHCRSTDNPGHPATIGIMVHEIGHDLDWPDLYDTDGSSQGVGDWSVMASGSWNRTGSNSAGSSPAHPDAFSKWYQGWLTPTRVLGVMTGVSIPQVETNAQVVQLLNNPNGVDWDYRITSGTGEYFLVENRQLVGYDAGLPGCGLLIWHIDETRTAFSPPNDNENRPLVDLEEADGDDDLYGGNNQGDSGDPYPGSSNNRTFNVSSYPNSNLYSGAASSASVTNISSGCATIMTADMTAPAPFQIFLPIIMK
jgi:M6 family metalloprotease-like protein